MLDPQALARTIADAYARRIQIPAPTAAGADFDLATAYATEAALVESRRASGRRTVGLKVGFANKAVWRVMKLDTLVWAHMYDDTVHTASSDPASLSTASMFSPKIEPEIVFKIARPAGNGNGSADGAAASPADVLGSVEWIAIGFEIIDCVYPEWKFQPADFVAAYGLHAALVVGEQHPVDAAAIPALVDQLAKFTVRLSRDGEVVAEGSGRNSLAQPGALPGGAQCGDRPPAWSGTAGRRRTRQLRDTHRVTTNCRGADLACGGRWIDLKPLTLTIRR